MKYTKCVNQYIKNLKKQTGYVLASSNEEKEKFINEGLNALYIAFKEVELIVDFNALEKALNNFGYKKLSINPSIYKIRNAEQFLSFNIGMLD